MLSLNSSNKIDCENYEVLHTSANRNNCSSKSDFNTYPERRASLSSTTSPTHGSYDSGSMISNPSFASTPSINALMLSRSPRFPSKNSNTDRLSLLSVRSPLMSKVISGKKLTPPSPVPSSPSHSICTSLSFPSIATEGDLHSAGQGDGKKGKLVNRMQYDKGGIIFPTD